MGTRNEYSAQIRDFDRIPKAVFAAIAVSSLTCGGDHLSDAERLIAEEWWILYEQGIVPQRPTVPKPPDES